MPNTLPEPSSFVGNGPDYNSYIQSGIQAVAQPLGIYNQQQALVAQRAQQQAALEAIQQRNQLNALLAPGEVTQQQQQLAAGKQTNDFNAQANPFRLQALGNDATISGVNAQYAAPDAYNRTLNNRINLTSALSGIGPTTTYNPDGSIANQRPGLPLAGMGADNSLPSNSSAIGGNPLFGTVRTTTYGINDPQSDPDTAAGRTSTGAPVIPASPGMAGTAAVDPKQIPYGSIIKLKDGSTYVAGDTGGAVKAQTASGGNAPVIDLVGRPGSVADWNDVSITPPTANYVGLTRSQKLAYHQAAAQNSAQSTQSIPGADLSNLTPIGQADSTGSPISVSQDGGALDRAINTAQGLPGAIPLQSPPVHPAVSNALSVANQTAQVAPAASAAIAQKALGLHESLNTPAIGGPVSTIASSIPSISAGTIPLYQPSAPVPAYPGPDGRMILGNPTPGLPVRNQMLPPPQENPKAAEILKDAADKGVDTRPFRTEPSATNPNGSLDVVGLQSALAAKTQSLPISRFTQEYQTNKDIQAYHTAANQVNSIADNLNRFPFATRDASNDNAIEKSAGGNELPGQAVSEASLKSIGSGQTYGEDFNNFLSKTPVLGAVNGIRSTLPSASSFLLGSLGTSLPSQPRNLSDRVLKSTADTTQSNVASRLPQYLQTIGRLKSQMVAEGINPDVVIPPSEEQAYVNAATRQMYPTAQTASPATSSKVRVSDGKQVIEIPNDPDKIKAAQSRGFHPI